MKIFEGKIVSVGTNKTAVVEVVRVTAHPLYKKLIKRSKKYSVDTAEHEVIVGNLVKIIEIRPISKTKYFRISAVMGQKTKTATETKTKKVAQEKPKAVKKTVKKEK